MIILNPNDLLKLKQIPKYSFYQDTELGSVYQTNEAGQREFYEHYFPDGPHILTTDNGPRFHHLCMYWLDNSLKRLITNEISELLPDYIPVYYTRLSFLGQPKY